MATAPRFNVNLGLAAVPDVANQETLSAVIPIYNAIRALASGLDTFTGTKYIDPDEYQDQTDAAMLTAANTAKIFRKFGEAVSAYQTVRISGSLAYKGTSGTVVGFAVGPVAINEWGCIVLLGYWPIGGLTAGEVYCAGATAGQIALASSLPTNQKLGRALGTAGIFFNPNLA